MDSSNNNTYVFVNLVRRERFTTTIALNTAITFVFASAHTPMALMFQARGRNSLLACRSSLLKCEAETASKPKQPLHA